MRTVLNRRRRYPAGSHTYDDFGKAVAGASLASRTPTRSGAGATWTVHAGSFTLDNRALSSVHSSVSVCLTTIQTGISDVLVSAVVAIAAAGAARNAGIMVRYTNGQNFIHASLDPNNNWLRLTKAVANAFTVVGTYNMTVTPGQLYRLAVRAVGDQLWVYVDNVLVLGTPLTAAMTVAEHTTVTRHGIRSAQTIGGAANIWRKWGVMPAIAPADAVVVPLPLPVMTSSYRTAVSHVAIADLRGGDATAVARAKASLATGLYFHRQSVMSYGANDPWEWDGTGERPAEPWNWSNLDANLQMIADMNGTPILGFAQWPWHMRGIWDGTITTPCTVADRLSDNGRPLTDSIADVRHFVRRVAERFLPLGVRWWQLTNWEAHGFERDREGGFTDQGFDDYAGTPAHSDMGMAYLHNQVYAELMAVAGELGIDRSELHILTGYFRLGTRGVPNAESVAVGHPLREQVWGTANKVGINAILGHLPLLTPGSFDYWGYDIGSLNQDDVVLTDDWTNLQKFTAIGQHIKDLVAAIGFGDKGCFVSERYTKPQTDPGINQQQLRAAINAEAERRFLLLGITSAIYWSPIGRANEPGAEAEAGLITSVATSDGGQTQAAFDALKLYHDYFSAGTPIHDCTVTGTGVSAIAMPQKILVINHDNVSKTVDVASRRYTLAENEVKLVDW